tara:strand:+ start:769 stop:1197 length:429 start_codon:yes stop_codon:yes gene_type:complete
MKYFLITVFLGFFSSVSYSQEHETDDFLVIQNQKIPLGVLIKEISKTLPQTIDKNTKWVSVKKGIEKKSIVYNYLITSMGKEDFSESGVQMLKEEQTPFLQNYYCTQPGFIPLRENNIKLEHNYSGKNNKYLFSIFTENSDC